LLVLLKIGLDLRAHVRNGGGSGRSLDGVRSSPPRRVRATAAQRFGGRRSQMAELRGGGKESVIGVDC
jgi:hypothetical protein